MDLNIAVIQKVKESFNCHVGEFIPQGVDYPYIWVGKASEEYSEDLCHPAVVDYVRYDIEIVSLDINEAREMSATLKKNLLNTPLHSIEFINDQEQRQTVHGVIVQDHDDSYVPKVPDSEEAVYIAAIDTEIIMGELV